MIIIENLPGKSHPGKNKRTIHVSNTDCLLHPIRFKHCCHAANVHNILFPGTTRPIKYQLSPVRNKGTGVLFHSRIGSKADARGDLVSGTVSPCQLLHLLPKVSGILPSFLIGMNGRVENETETEIGTDGPVFQQIKDHIFRPVAVLFDTDSRTGNRIVVTADHPFRNGGFQVAQGERSADGIEPQLVQTVVAIAEAGNAVLHAEIAGAPQAEPPEAFATLSSGPPTRRTYPVYCILWPESLPAIPKQHSMIHFPTADKTSIRKYIRIYRKISF